jgi:hypothetical protein
MRSGKDKQTEAQLFKIGRRGLEGRSMEAGWVKKSEQSPVTR